MPGCGELPNREDFNALLTLLGRRSRQSIYDLIRRDPSFPRPRQIGSEFSVGWLRGEVMEWLNARPLVIDEIVAGEVLDDGVKLDVEPLPEHLQSPVLRPRRLVGVPAP